MPIIVTTFEFRKPNVGFDSLIICRVGTTLNFLLTITFLMVNFLVSNQFTRPNQMNYFEIKLWWFLED